MTEIEPKTQQGQEGPAGAQQGSPAVDQRPVGTESRSLSDTASRPHLLPSMPVRLCGFIAPLVLFLVLDRASKALVLSTLVAHRVFIEWIPGVMRLQFVANTGAAFSIGEGHGYVFVALAVLVTIAISIYLARASRVSILEVIGLGMVAGGAVGNAIDRVLYGYVVDFLATEFIDFPVFNVADIGITVGVVLAFAGFMFVGSRSAGPRGSSEDAGAARG